MSTPDNTTPGHAPANQPQTIKVVSHTALIYWWPVWLVGFILSGLTYAEGDRLAVVPPGTRFTEVEPGKVYELTVGDEPARSLRRAAVDSGRGENAFPVRISPNKNYGI